MFIDGLFNYSNWNGGDGIIRQLFSLYRKDGVHSGTKVEDLEFTYGADEFWGDIIITHTYNNDQNYATITFSCRAEIEGVYQLDKLEHVAYFRWYKNRGTTESAKYNGERMSEDQYLFILNAIQATGFKFDLT